MNPGTPDLQAQPPDAQQQQQSQSAPEPLPEPLPVHQKRSFFMRLRQRAVSRSDPAQYELVYARGHLRIPGKAAPGPSGHGASHGHRRKSHGKGGACYPYHIPTFSIKSLARVGRAYGSNFLFQFICTLASDNHPVLLISSAVKIHVVVAESSSSSNDIVLVAVIQLVREPRICEESLLEATKDEYITRHTMDGRIIYCDHRYIL